MTSTESALNMQNTILSGRSCLSSQAATSRTAMTHAASMG